MSFLQYMIENGETKNTDEMDGTRETRRPRISNCAHSSGWQHLSGYSPPAESPI